MNNRIKRNAFAIALLALGFFGLCTIPKSFGVVPAPDGGYAGGNTAEGQSSLFSLTSGLYNTGVGIYSLLSLTDGNFNTGVGAGTLLANTADENTATGAGALLSNTTGNSNTANGAFALFSNSSGFFNTATGDGALELNSDGGGNTAIGYFALHNATGGGNIAIGVGSGTNLTAGDNNIYIGNVGLNGDANTTRIGIAKTTERTFIGGIRGVTTGINDAVNVVIDSAGQLGTVSSSRRFKHDIKPMDGASESILALKPVTFHYKSDDKKSPQFGLIAEEVAEINPDLVVHDENGQIYTVRYDAVNAMLLNEFLKEHKAFVEEQGKVREQEATITALKSKVDRQEATIAQQQTEMRTVMARLNEQAAQIQRVSAQIQVNKPVTKVAEAGR